MRRINKCIGLLLVLSATTANAYIGPGAGAGTIAVVLGVIGSIFLAFLAILWYPVKRLFKRRKTAKKRAAEAQVETSEDTSEEKAPEVRPDDE